MEIPSAFEESVDKRLDKPFGDKDAELKYLTKLAMMDDGSEHFQRMKEQAIQTMKLNHCREIENLLCEMSLTFDKDGKIID
jgi:hypothetical protein